MKKTPKDYTPDWPEVSLAVKSAAKWTCQACGEKFLNECSSKFVGDGARRKLLILTVHHKDRNPINNAPENLICLCSACHCRAELPLIRQEKRAEREKDQADLFGGGHDD
jgi:hypothetical protein